MGSIADAIYSQMSQAGKARTTTQTSTVKEPVDIGSLGLLISQIIQGRAIQEEEAKRQKETMDLLKQIMGLGGMGGVPGANLNPAGIPSSFMMPTSGAAGSGYSTGTVPAGQQNAIQLMLSLLGGR